MTAAAKKVHLFNKPSLTDTELATVAIAYNTGGFNPAKGLKQGHFDGHKFYGENFFDFLQRAKKIPEAPVMPPPVIAAVGAQAGAAPL